MTGAEQREELVREGFRAYNARDMGALMPLLDPAIEVHNDSGLLNAGTFHGHDGYRRWTALWEEAWEDFQNTPQEVEAIGDSHVVARVHANGRGRGSGVEVSREVGYVYELGDGGCTYLAVHPSFEAARRVALEREGLTG